MNSVPNRLKKYAYGKRSRIVYLLRKARPSREEHWRLRFLTAGFALLALGLSSFISHFFPVHPFAVGLIDVVLLFGAVEAAETVWLDRFAITNISEISVIRGLTLFELFALEDTVRLSRENFPGIRLWKRAGRRIRQPIRLLFHYWPVTLYLVVSAIPN